MLLEEKASMSHTSLDYDLSWQHVYRSFKQHSSHVEVMAVVIQYCKPRITQMLVCLLLVVFTKLLVQTAVQSPMWHIDTCWCYSIRTNGSFSIFLWLSEKKKVILLCEHLTNSLVRRLQHKKQETYLDLGQTEIKKSRRSRSKPMPWLLPNVLFTHESSNQDSGKVLLK